MEMSLFIYLIQKHKDEIVNKDNNMTKKWGHKKILQKRVCSYHTTLLVIYSRNK